jgi:hypothetical protein
MAIRSTYLEFILRRLRVSAILSSVSAGDEAVNRRPATRVHLHT